MHKQTQKHFYIFLLIISLTTFAIISIYEVRMMFFIQSNDYNQLIDIAKHGDLIVSQSIEWQSMVTSAFTNDEFSHIGIIIERNQKKFVLHSSPDNGQYSLKGKSRMDPLAQFLFDSKAKKFALYRITSIINQKINVDKYINKEFDGEFNFNDSSKLYCTELVIKALQETNPDFKLIAQERVFNFLNLSYHIVTPSTFLTMNSENIVKIYEWNSSKHTSN